MKRIIYRVFGLIGLLFFFLNTSFLSAQPDKRGKPNLKAFKAEKKRAKKGDLKAGLTLVKVCRGSMLTPDEAKDYKKALKYYDKFVADDVNKLPAGQRGERTLFDMYFTGGYGIDPNIEKARQLLQVLRKHQNLKRLYAYKTNLFLPDIFETQEQAGLGKAHAQYLMGRYLLEYAIDFQAGINWLVKARERNNRNAAYLYDRWQLLHQKRKLDSPREWSLYLRKSMLKVAAQHLEKSTDARLEYAFLRTMEEPMPELKEIREVLDPILRQDYPNKEEQLKALTILEKVQRGNDRLPTLRRILTLASGLDSAELAFTMDNLLEIKDVESKMQTIEGLHQLLTERDDLEGVEIDLSAHKNNYQGDIQPLVTLYKTLKKPENASLITPEHLQGYEIEIAKKVEEVFQAANTAEKVLAMRTAMEEEPIMQKFYPSYKSRFRNKLVALGVSTEDLDYFSYKKALDGMKFTSWQQARNKLREISDDMSINPSAQMRLRSYIKYKVIRDLYGENPSMREIEQLRNTLYRQSWLSPEGDKVCFAYMRDSENWFTGEVQRHSYIFQYTVTREDPDSDEYDLKIMYVYNGRSNLAYKSTLRANQVSDDTYSVSVYLANRKSYRWVESTTDYLKALYKDNSSYIEPMPVGKLSRARRTDHGQSEQALKQKVQPADFSAKTAIRSALKYFILEYVGAMNI